MDESIELKSEVTEEEARWSSVTVRSIAIGAALIPLTCMWVVQAEILWYSSQPTTVSLMPHVVFILFFLTLANLLVGRLAPGSQLNPGELLTIYVMLSLASVVCGHDSLEILVPMVTHGYYDATPENGWAASFHEFLPKWVLLDNREIVRGFYEGGSSMYRWDVVLAWARPLLWWASFVFALITSLFLVNALLRKQWTENEKLSYPVIQIPLALSTRAMTLFSTRLLWYGFAIAAGIDLLNGLGEFFPAIPQIPIVHIDNLRNYLTERPWNTMGNVWFSLYPFAIGVCFFLPLDLAFSCWFFFIFWKLQHVVASSLGYQIPGLPFVNDQTAGGYLALCLVALWVSRRYLRDLTLRLVGGGSPSRWRSEVAYALSMALLAAGAVYLQVVLFRLEAAQWVRISSGALELLVLLFAGWFLRRSFFEDTGADKLDDKDEALPYRVSAALLLLCLAYVGVFLHQLGMRWEVVPLFIVIYLAIAIAIARMRAELGPPAHDLHYGGPDQMIPRFFGMKALGGPTLVALCLTWFFNRAYRGHAIAPSLEGFKIAQQARMSARRMLIAMLIALALGIFGGFWSMLHIGYKHGMQASVVGPGNWFGYEVYRNAHGWIQNPLPPNRYATIATGVGIASALFLALLRMRFAWWPLHPVGYAVSGSWSMEQLWFPMFISWVLKAIILRYGGAKAYKRAIPFFIGLVLGEFVVGCYWGIHGAVFGCPTYDFWPY